MFSSPWKHISCCRMCPYLPKCSKPPGLCSLSILFGEALQIRAGLRSGELPSQSFFSGENSLAIKLEHPSRKCNRDFSLSILPSLLGSRLHGFLALLEPVRQISLTGTLGSDPGLTYFLTLGYFGKPHISGSEVLVSGVWFCCGLGELKGS